MHFVVKIYYKICKESVLLKYNNNQYIIKLINNYETLYEFEIHKLRQKHLKQMNNLTLDYNKNKRIDIKINNINKNINKINQNIKILTQSIYEIFRSRALMNISLINKIADIKYKQTKQNINVHCERSIDKYKKEHLPNIVISIERSQYMLDVDIVIELYDEITPKICHHFRDFGGSALKKKLLKFNKKANCVEIDMDIDQNTKFERDSFELKHDKPGLITAIPNTNKFLIMFDENRELNNKYIVFGKIIRGWSYIFDLKLFEQDICFIIISCKLAKNNNF